MSDTAPSAPTEATATGPAGETVTASAAAAPATATVKTIEHLEPSQLPQTSSIKRTAYVFLITVLLIALAWRVIDKVTDPITLRMIARYSLLGVGLCIFIYLAGATATDVVRLVGAIRTTRKETVTTAGTPEDTQ